MGRHTLLISPAAVRLFGNPSNLPMAFVGQGLLWAIAVAVVAIVLFWERRPLASLWLQPFRWQSIAWGFALVAINYAVIFPVGEWLRHAAGVSGFTQGMEQVMRFPISYRIAAVMGAGVVEELLFRGYTVSAGAASHKADSVNESGLHPGYRPHLAEDPIQATGDWVRLECRSSIGAASDATRGSASKFLNQADARFTAHQGCKYARR